MSYRVILPKDYEKNKDVRYPVIYLLHGQPNPPNRPVNLRLSSNTPEVRRYLASHNFIYVIHEGGAGYYTDSATVPDDKYESYFIQEVIPEIEKNFRTKADRQHRIIAGGSMGGYGAIKFGLKYPEKFSLVGSFAGSIGASTATVKQYGDAAKIYDVVFGPEDSETRKKNNLFKLVEQLTPEQIKALPMIYQSCGTEDFLIDFNRQFLAVLQKKKVKHEYREFPGDHNSAFMDPQKGEFLNIVERHLKKQYFNQ
jgi:S-formylglutathione hydrolase FrmB